MIKLTYKVNFLKFKAGDALNIIYKTRKIEKICEDKKVSVKYYGNDMANKINSKSYIAIPPGESIREQLDIRYMSQKEFALRMSMSEKHVSNLLNGKVSLTNEVANRLERVLGVPARFWNRLESLYREDLRKVEAENLADKEINFIDSFPYKDMVKAHMVKKASNHVEKHVNLCQFFEVANLSVLDDKRIWPIACRQLGDTDKAMRAKLVVAQYAKLHARNISVDTYKKDKIDKALHRLKQYTKYESFDFFEEIQTLLARCGIALVLVPHIPGSFLQGVSFIDESSKKIVVGITLRQKRADVFWFTLYHELVHIMEGHLDRIEGLYRDDESIADTVASNWLIDSAAYHVFTNQSQLSIQEIREFADTQEVGVSLVIGRLQKDKIIGYNQFTTYIATYSA